MIRLIVGPRRRKTGKGAGLHPGSHGSWPGSTTLQGPFLRCGKPAIQDGRRRAGVEIESCRTKLKSSSDCAGAKSPPGRNGLSLPARSRLGLTLVELSMVVLIMGILFAVMFGVFFRASEIVREGSPPSETRQRAMLALESMRTAINNTYYMADIERLLFYGKSEVKGDGHMDRLTLASVVPGAEESGTPEVREVSFYLAEPERPQNAENAEENQPGQPRVQEERGYTLYRREDQHVDEKPGEGGAHYPLADHVLSLRFRYSYNAKTWYDEWNTKKTSPLPRLIQIQMVIQVAGRKERLETLASPGLYIN